MKRLSWAARKRTVVPRSPSPVHKAVAACVHSMCNMNWKRRTLPLRDATHSSHRMCVCLYTLPFSRCVHLVCRSHQSTHYTVKCFSCFCRRIRVHRAHSCEQNTHILFANTLEIALFICIKLQTFRTIYSDIISGVKGCSEYIYFTYERYICKNYRNISVLLLKMFYSYFGRNCDDTQRSVAASAYVKKCDFSRKSK